VTPVGRAIVATSRDGREDRVVGVWNDQLLPRCTNVLMGAPEITKLRERVCAGLTGTVVQVGFGSGLDLPVLPPTVERILAVEPSLVARRLAADRIAASPVRVEWTGVDGEGLPIADDVCDSALSTFTLCTIPRVEQALAELRRVLKPGGRFHFLEHGLAESPGTQRWQHRLDGVQVWWAGGCHLVRPIDELVVGAGFAVEECERFRMRGPATHGSLYLGVAANPA
jgi:SAM-dependent methyltransferase